MPYLEIAFNLPPRNTYTYQCEKTVPLGCRVKTILGYRKLTGWVVGYPEHAPEGLASIRGIESRVDEQPLFNQSQLTVARWMSDLCMCSLGEALSAMLPGAKRESRELPVIDENDATGHVDTLTANQQSAIDSIDTQAAGWFYLFGSAGSGKTEVYLRIAEKVLARGGGVIYLVPEIALSHQLIKGLQKRFSGRVAVIHSHLTSTRRLCEWRRIQAGEANFVLGARSAVFAPLNNLGLIIIDEEHEGSYKSAFTPRYHARQIAMKRCKISSAKLLMGSATPSLEAWFLLNSGQLQRLSLQGRPAGGAQPHIRVVDLRKEKGLFSTVLMRTMSRVLGENRQVLLFLNRRGFSYQYSCHSCGKQIYCQRCSVPLTYHKASNVMKCHYCGFRLSPPHSCPECSSLDMKAAGFGTEKIEQEIFRLFPEKRVVRLDTDTARRKGVLQNTLREFQDGAIDILLGTQMVAKGLNAPGVKLAAVLLADNSLNLPDFRSAERTFAQIVQVAGRAGRFLPDGEVIVQTFRPNAAPIRLAAENRIPEFYEYEIAQRRMLSFPPFTRLFRIVFKGVDESRVCQVADTLAASLSDKRGLWDVMGPAECPIGRIAGQYRRHCILRTTHFDRTHAALASAMSTLKIPHGVRFEIDIDPVILI